VGECSFVRVRLKNMSKTKDHEIFLVLVEATFLLHTMYFPHCKLGALLCFGVGSSIKFFL